MHHYYCKQELQHNIIIIIIIKFIKLYITMLTDCSEMYLYNQEHNVICTPDTTQYGHIHILIYTS